MCKRLLYLTSFILVFGFALTNAAEAQVDPNLIGWWKLDEVSGITAADSSGNGNDGTLVGGPQWVSGYIDGALDLDGAGDYVDCGYDPIFDVTDELTVAAWVTIRSVPNQWISIVAKGEYSWRLTNYSSERMFHFGITIWSAQGPSVDGRTAVGLDEWHHVTGTYDGSSISLYLDGLIDNAITTTSPIGINTANVLIGENPEAAGRYWDGFIDDVRIYDRALSQAEIGALMPPQLKATLPYPADKAKLSSTDIILSWIPGDTAVRHHLYIGESFDDVKNGAGGTDQGLLNVTSSTGYTWEIGKTYYWRVEEAEADGTPIHPGDVWSFTILPLTASNPVPGDGAEYVVTDILLEWTAGAGAIEHEVYFGDNIDDVKAGRGGTSKGVVEEPNFSPGPLDYNKTYYWSVDEFDGLNSHTGDIWSFTTVGPTDGAKGEYYNNIDLTGNPVLTRLDPKIDFDWGDGSPDPLVDQDNFSVRWTAELEVPFTETYTFSTVSDDCARLWIDGQLIIDNWDEVDNAWAIEDKGTIDLDAGWASLKMEFFDSGGAAMAQLSWKSPSMPRQIISPGVLSPPLRARDPIPSNKATEVSKAPNLQWTQGGEATHHDVYFGTDYNEVAQADISTLNIYRGRQDLENTTYTPSEAPLEWNTTYYWRVDEINQDPLIGKVWSFTTGNFLVVDDFEDYNDYPPNEVFMVWIDGYGDPTNGSSAGYPDPDFPMGEHYLEDEIVRSGDWSMPLFYDNSAGLSEVTRALNANWTLEGVVTLTLFYYGDAANAAEPMYVVLNGNVVVNNNDADAALVTEWIRWDIPLQVFADQGVNLSNVGSMSIGFGNKANPTAGGGTGVVYFDDIRLYRPEQ